MDQNVAQTAQAVEEVEVEVEAEAEVVAPPTEEELFKADALTPQEAAIQMGGKDAGWTGKRLRRFIRDGSCHSRKIGGRWYCTIEDLETFLGVLEAREATKAAKLAAEAAKAAAVVTEADVDAEIEAMIEAEEVVETGSPLG